MRLPGRKRPLNSVQSENGGRKNCEQFFGVMLCSEWCEGRWERLISEHVIYDQGQRPGLNQIGPDAQDEEKDGENNARALWRKKRKRANQVPQ